MRTVGQILSEARLTKGITFAEAERNTKIRTETLQALEADNFSALPSSIYIRGFIKNYADYLGLDPERTLAIFRRQFEEVPPTEPIIPDLSPKGAPKLTLTPGRALGLGISVMVLGFLGYLLAQYQSFAAAPLIEISSPGDGLKVNNGTIEATGRTDRDAVLRINGQEIPLTESGAFSVSVSLPDGTSDLTFSATNKLGRVTTVNRMVSVTTTTAAAPIGPSAATSSAQPAVSAAKTTPAKGGLTMTITIGPNRSYVEVTADSLSYKALLKPGDTKTFTASSRIEILIGNAGSTDVNLNGQDLGKFGSEGQIITKTFTANQ